MTAIISINATVTNKGFCIFRVAKRIAIPIANGKILIHMQFNKVYSIVPSTYKLGFLAHLTEHLSYDFTPCAISAHGY